MVIMADSKTIASAVKILFIEADGLRSAGNNQVADLLDALASACCEHLPEGQEAEIREVAASHRRSLPQVTFSTFPPPLRIPFGPRPSCPRCPEVDGSAQ